MQNSQQCHRAVLSSWLCWLLLAGLASFPFRALLLSRPDFWLIAFAELLNIVLSVLLI